MADNDNPNELSKKPQPNSKSYEDPGFEAIKEIGRRYSTRTAIDSQERLRLEQAREQIEGLESLIEDHPELAKKKFIEKGLKAERKTVNKLEPRISLRRETTRERAIKETISRIGREFSETSVNAQIRRGVDSYSAQARSFSMTGQSQRELERERSSIVKQIRQLEGTATQKAQNELFDEESNQSQEVVDDIRKIYRQKRVLTGRASSIDAALQKKKQEGTDYKSIDRDLFSIGAKAQETLFRRGVSDELRSGKDFGALNIAQLKEKEVEQARGLTEALEKLKNSAGESAEKIDDLRNEAKDAAEGLKKTQEAIRQRGKFDEEGPGIGRRLIQATPGMLNTAAAAMQESLINQPMTTLNNRLGYASLSNAQYAQRGSAIRGDMTALLAATTQAGGAMSGIGENFRENSNIVRGTNLAAGAITTGLGVAQVASGIKNNINPIAQGAGTANALDIVGGVRTTVEGVAQTTTAATDLINQSSASTAKLGGESVAFGLNNEVQKVRGDFRQSFFDYSMGTRQAALAAGGRGGRSIMDQFAADQGNAGGLLGRLQEARLAPNEFARLSGEAATNQGSVFNTSSIFQARNLERSGVGTIDQNVQRMSTLASAGANNPQTAMTSVLEAAFSKGLDSSKALNMMVQNTAEMVRTSAGATMLGIDTTKSASERLAALTNPDMPNREAAITRAATAEERLNEINTGIGVNFSDMLTTTRMAREGNVNSVTAMNLKKLDNSTADALQQQLMDFQKIDKSAPGYEKARSNLETALFRAGAGGFVNESGEIRAEDASKALRIRGMSALAGGNFLNLVSPDTAGYDEFQSGKLSGEQIKQDPKYRRLREQISTAAATGGLTEDEIFAQVQRVNGKSPITDAARAQVAEANAGRGGSKALRDADEAATADATDMANKARLAAKELGGAADALSKINKQMQSLVGNLNDNTSKSFQNASADAAASFSNSAGVFFNASKAFSDSVNVFSRIPTSTGDAISAAMRPITEKLNTISDKLGSIMSKAGSSEPGSRAADSIMGKMKGYSDAVGLTPEWAKTKPGARN